MPLSERQQAILDFERTWWQLEGSKEAAIRERFATDDPLAWNLDILLSVCNALRFAHKTDGHAKGFSIRDFTLTPR